MTGTSLALCASCGASNFQIVITDLAETTRCARCHTEHASTPAWIAAYGRTRTSGNQDFEALREVMERQAKALQAH